MEALSLLHAAFDGLLGLGLLWIAWRSLASPDPFTAIVLFVAFGLLMALAWVRLDAPDVALAEAAIGAGLTGALLLVALARLRAAESPPGEHGWRREATPGGRAARWLALPVALLVAGGLALTIAWLPSPTPGLGAEVARHLAVSGVSNPVTAVLLNFRAYDTLLEMAVLWLALLGVGSLAGPTLQLEGTRNTVLEQLTRLLAPLLIVVAGYLLWTGASAPGGAFQAGSVLGAAGVVMQLAGWRMPAALTPVRMRLLIVAGPGAFLALALLTVLAQGHMLEFPPAQAGLLILVLEIVATLSIGATLTALFLGGHLQPTRAHR